MISRNSNTFRPSSRCKPFGFTDSAKPNGIFRSVGRLLAAFLANISTRGLVQTGDDVMIGGIIILGTDAQQVLLRAIGPSLPVPGALADPTLELHDKDGVIIVSNDDWRSDQEAEIIATTIPPTDDAESAILATLTPDAYTVIVRAKNDTTGAALVEAYQLDN